MSLLRRLAGRVERPRRFTGGCPIREYTGDGAYVGRCEFSTHDGVCPRHGRLSDYPDNDDRAVDPRSRRFDTEEETDG